MSSEAKDRRLTFAAGYADAWAKRSPKDERSSEYMRGYDEGLADRSRANSPGRKPARRW